MPTKQRNTPDGFLGGGIFVSETKPSIVVIGTPGTEAADTINVAITYQNSDQIPMASKASLMAYISDDSAGTGLAATAPDGGVAIGTNGDLLQTVTDKMFMLTCNTAGLVDIDITQSGADTFYLVILDPDGGLTVSDAITFAA
jgi:hypothetical protein